MGEGVIPRDAEDLAVEISVGTEALRDGTEFLSADAGEGHGDEEEEDVLFARLLGEFDYFRSVCAEGHEGEIRGFIANVNAHIVGDIGEEGAADKWSIGIFSKDCFAGCVWIVSFCD